MTETRRPYSDRAAGRAPAPPIEGLPPHIVRRVKEWLYKVLEDAPGPPRSMRPGREGQLTQEIMIRLGLDGVRPWEISDDEEGAIIDAVDAVLRWTPWSHCARAASPSDLQRILAIGNSTLRVSDQFDGLERRIDATATTAFAATIKSASDKAADHLRVAWEKVYGQHPEPDTAYREAVLAVEEIASPLVLPTDGKARLGKVRDALRDGSRKWEIVLPDYDDNYASVDVIVAMLTALEAGQRSRHAGTPTTRRQTPAEAEAVVHLAATLVHWLSTGFLRKKS